MNQRSRDSSYSALTAKQSFGRVRKVITQAREHFVKEVAWLIRDNEKTKLGKQ